MERPSDIIIHASCVSWHDRALLILGASGAGKSGLALQLMAYGCKLVADDRTALSSSPPDLIASCPDPIRDLIEARGVGLLYAETVAQARVAWAVDLDHEETERLPHNRKIDLLGHSIPLLHAVKSPHFAASVLQLLKAGRQEDNPC